MATLGRSASPRTPSRRSAPWKSRAIPTPAAPAPAITRRSSTSFLPAAREAAKMPATATAAVPWMSSLKEGSSLR